MKGRFIIAGAVALVAAIAVWTGSCNTSSSGTSTPVCGSSTKGCATGSIMDSSSGAGVGGATAGGGAEGTVKPDPRRPYTDLCGDSKTCTPGLGQCLSPSLDASKDVDGCSLVPSEGAVVGSCAPNGDGDVGHPCTAVTDCAAGLGCVTSADGSAAGGGACRPYCCQDVEVCPDKTFCTPLPMADDAVNAPRLTVPVCVPTTNCQLLDDTSCPAGQTCTIVRASGTTSCVAPGEGQLGGDCPCAAGFVCAKLTGQCKKLCHLGQDEVDCPNGGTCQGGSQGYPDGIGICVGGTSNQY